MNNVPSTCGRTPWENTRILFKIPGKVGNVRKTALPCRQVNWKRLIRKQIFRFFQADREKVCMRGTLEKSLVTGEKLALLKICSAA